MPPAVVFAISIKRYNYSDGGFISMVYEIGLKIIYKNKVAKLVKCYDNNMDSCPTARSSLQLVGPLGSYPTHKKNKNRHCQKQWQQVFRANLSKSVLLVCYLQTLYLSLPLYKSIVGVYMWIFCSRDSG